MQPVEEPYQPDFHFPCFLIRSENGKGIIYFDLPDGGKAVPLLTDEDSAERYCREKALHSREFIRFGTPVALAVHLVALGSVGVTHIAIDPYGLRSGQCTEPLSTAVPRLYSLL